MLSPILNCLLQTGRALPPAKPPRQDSTVRPDLPARCADIHRTGWFIYGMGHLGLWAVTP